jgi:hypothetical protein
MKIYHYDDNGIFLRASDARENPMVLGEYLVPARATAVRPPDAEPGKIVLWSGGAWQVSDDPRGEWYDTATGVKRVLGSPLASTEGLTRAAPGDCEKWNGSTWAFDLDEYKARKSEEIRARTRALILAGFDSTSKGRHFAMELEDQANWNSLLTDILLGIATFPQPIQDINGIPVSFSSAEEVQATYAEGSARKKALLAADGQLEAQVSAATTKTQVDAVVDERI